MFHKSLVSLSLLLLLVSVSFGQSGRGRPQPPQPKPPVSTKPTTTPPTTGTTPSADGKIAPGGQLSDISQVGLTNRYVFRNGLTVILSEDHSTPIVSVLAFVKAGTTDEPETARGVARVTGEVLLRGTTAHPGDSWRQQADLAGARFQAEVDLVSTQIGASGPVESAATMVQLLAEALMRPGLTEASAAQAIQTVQRQLATQTEDAARLSAGRWLSTAYPQHPLGRAEAIPDQLLALKPEMVAQFHTAHFTPKNTVICLTGDMIAPVVLRTFQQSFGAWASTAVSPKLPESGQTALHYQEERGATTASWVHIGYPVPPNSEDSAAFDVLCAILGRGRGARLVQSLRDQRGIVSDIQVDYVTNRNLAHFLIGLRVKPESLDRAEALTFEIIERLRRERISDADLQRAKSLLEKDFLTRTESTQNQARTLAQVEATGGFKAWTTSLSRINQVTAEQIRAVAAKYLMLPKATVHEFQSPTAPLRTFTPEKYAETVNILVPASTQTEIPSEAITDAKSVPMIRQGTTRQKQQDVGKFIVMAQAEPVKDFSTLRGPRAFVRVDPNRPLLVMWLFFQGGRTLEDETNSGVTELMLRSMLQGTAKQPGDTLASELEQLGGEIRIVNDPDYFGLELEILSRNGEEGLRRLVDVIENPTFDKEAVKREGERLLADQQALTNAGSETALDLARSSLFGQHTYGFPRLGTTAVAKMTEVDVQRWLERTVKRQYPLAVIVGDTEGSVLVSRVLVDGFNRDETDRAIKVRVIEPNPKPAEQIGTSTRPVSYLNLVWLAPEGQKSVAAEWLVVAEVIASHLARQAEEAKLGGAIFDSRYVPHLQYGEFILTAGTTVVEEPKLRSMVDALIKGLATVEISESEWQGACRRAATREAQEIETFSGRARAYATAAFMVLPVAIVERNIENALRAASEDGKSVFATLGQSVPGRGVIRGTALPATPVAAPQKESPSSGK